MEHTVPRGSIVVPCLGLPCRILNINHKKELPWSLGVVCETAPTKAPAPTTGQVRRDWLGRRGWTAFKLGYAHGLGFRVKSLGFRVKGLEFRV